MPRGNALHATRVGALRPNFLRHCWTSRISCALWPPHPPRHDLLQRACGMMAISSELRRMLMILVSAPQQASDGAHGHWPCVCGGDSGAQSAQQTLSRGGAPIPIWCGTTAGVWPSGVRSCSHSPLAAAPCSWPISRSSRISPLHHFVARMAAWL